MNAAHPFWSVGFRPFFTLAMLSGLSLPLLWVLIYLGYIPPPSHNPVQWHIHEMFFGFGWAVLGGFLLTATKNWVQIRGYHGYILMFLFAAWLFERVGMWFVDSWSPWFFYLSNNLFLGSIVAALLWTLIYHRKTDSYRDNFLFVLILPIFLYTKHLILSPNNYLVGASVATGLFRVALLVMLERTLSAFMRAGFKVEILRNRRLDGAIKALAVLLILASVLPIYLSNSITLVLAILLIGRLIYWKPQLAMRRLDIGIMYLGYAAIAAQLLIELLRSTWTIGATNSLHVFTLGAMGLIIPAMLIRISLGHTGKKVTFGKLDKAALYAMLLAFVLRLIAPQLLPNHYPLWLTLAATCWFICYGLLAWKYIPMLMRPRST